MTGWLRPLGRHSGAKDRSEQTVRGSLLLIGSALALSRGCHVRSMFGIEEFSGKLNGDRTLWRLLHVEHRGRAATIENDSEPFTVVL
jgi:hypothetical protein